MGSKPLLLIDVDGVISLFGFAPDAPPPGRWQLIDGVGHLISASAGSHLRALTTNYQLIWCTGWEERANEHLPHSLGLDTSLPYISFERTPGHGGAHWKLAAIDAHAGPDQPLAWIDDAHDDTCRRWARERRGPTLLIATDPAVGITAEHVVELSSWAAALLERAVAPGA